MKEDKCSKAQKAITVLSNVLSIGNTEIKKPTPFKWKKKPSAQFVEKAIKEGRN